MPQGVRKHSAVTFLTQHLSAPTFDHRSPEQTLPDEVPLLPPLRYKSIYEHMPPNTPIFLPYLEFLRGHPIGQIPGSNLVSGSSHKELYVLHSLRIPCSLGSSLNLLFLTWAILLPPTWQTSIHPSKLSAVIPSTKFLLPFYCLAHPSITGFITLHFCT